MNLTARIGVPGNTDIAIHQERHNRGGDSQINVGDEAAEKLLPRQPRTWAELTQRLSREGTTWFRTAKSQNGTSCCDEADGYREGVAVKIAHDESIIIFRSWWVASDSYLLSLVDPTNLRPIHLISDGPVVRDNPTGGAVVWLSRENGIVLVRCFSPGPQR